MVDDYKKLVRILDEMNVPPYTGKDWKIVLPRQDSRATLLAMLLVLAGSILVITILTCLFRRF